MGQHIVLLPTAQRLRRPRIMWDYNTALVLVDAVPTAPGPEYQDHDCNKETNGHKRACDNRKQYSSSTVDVPPDVDGELHDEESLVLVGGKLVVAPELPLVELVTPILQWTSLPTAHYHVRPIAPPRSPSERCGYPQGRCAQSARHTGFQALSLCCNPSQNAAMNACNLLALISWLPPSSPHAPAVRVPSAASLRGAAAPHLVLPADYCVCIFALHLFCVDENSRPTNYIFVYACYGTDPIIRLVRLVLRVHLSISVSVGLIFPIPYHFSQASYSVLFFSVFRKGLHESVPIVVHAVFSRTAVFLTHGVVPATRLSVGTRPHNWRSMCTHRARAHTHPRLAQKEGHGKHPDHLPQRRRPLPCRFLPADTGRAMWQRAQCAPQLRSHYMDVIAYPQLRAQHMKLPFLAAHAAFIASLRTATLFINVPPSPAEAPTCRAPRRPLYQLPPHPARLQRGGLYPSTPYGAAAPHRPHLPARCHRLQRFSTLPVGHPKDYVEHHPGSGQQVRRAFLVPHAAFIAFPRTAPIPPSFARNFDLPRTASMTWQIVPPMHPSSASTGVRSKCGRRSRPLRRLHPRLPRLSPRPPTHYERDVADSTTHANAAGSPPALRARGTKG
ncbi:hypothetical protein B0H19DRAFT_1386238 [Mycena capillaripes]|nr:hypothetical protein B0H19DRAFT_1386238 [Mycena capillaripes]